MIDPDQIPKDLLVEAGFLAGHVNYPEDQMSALRKFLGNESRARVLLTFFKRDILRYQRDSAKAFKASSLEKLFIEILGSVD
jgi:hypothetical protein